MEVTPVKIVVRAEIHADNDAKPQDYDCYTPKDIRGWSEDDWHFVGVMLHVELWLGPKCQAVMSTYESLWGIEDSDFFDGVDHATNYVNDSVVPDLLSQCVDHLRESGATLTPIQLAGIAPVFSDVFAGQKEERSKDL